MVGKVSPCPEKLPRVQKRVTDFLDYNIFDSGMDLPEPRDVRIPIAGSLVAARVRKSILRLLRTTKRSFAAAMVPHDACGAHTDPERVVRGAFSSQNAKKKFPAATEQTNAERRHL